MSFLPLSCYFDILTVVKLFSNQFYKCFFTGSFMLLIFERTL